jgi:hypothetical protein
LMCAVHVTAPVLRRPGARVRTDRAQCCCGDAIGTRRACANRLGRMH